MFHKCKITVIKRGCDKDLVTSFLNDPGNFSACNQVKDNQEFIIHNPYEMPEGICAYAWADIRPQILAIASGGTFSFSKDKNTTLATCTDPFRPVIFKIEKLSH